MKKKDIKRQAVAAGGFGNDNRSLDPNKSYVVTILGATERQSNPRGGQFAANYRVAAVEGSEMPAEEVELFESVIGPKALHPYCYSEEDKLRALANEDWFVVQYRNGTPYPDPQKPGIMITPKVWEPARKL